MYPSLDVSTPAASLAATAGPAAGGGAAGGGGGSFGDATGSGSGDGPLFPLLRVQVNSKLRVAPQVLIPPADPSSSSTDAADAVPRSNFIFEFDAERRAVEGAAGPSSSSSSLPSPSSEWTPPDPWSGLFEQLLLQMPPPGRGQGQGEGEPPSSSSSREEVALAAAAAAALAKAAAGAAGGAGSSEEESSSGGSSSSSVEATKRTLEPLRQLTQMGFDPRRSLGALVVSRGDLAAATDACLAAAAASGARI